MSSLTKVTAQNPSTYYFYFLGGINLLAALNFLLVPSEDEKLYDKISEHGQREHVTVEPMIGPIVGLRMNF